MVARLMKRYPEHYDEVLAAAMMLGEYQPVLCSCCWGRGQSAAFFGYRRCIQCEGSGYDMIGTQTRVFLDNLKRTKR